MKIQVITQAHLRLYLRVYVINHFYLRPKSTHRTNEPVWNKKGNLTWLNFFLFCMFLKPQILYIFSVNFLCFHDGKNDDFKLDYIFILLWIYPFFLFGRWSLSRTLHNPFIFFFIYPIHFNFEKTRISLRW